MATLKGNIATLLVLLLPAKCSQSIARGLLFQMATIAFVTTTTIATEKPTTKDMAQARNYVLAACIIDRYSGTPIATEADAWASGLVENGACQRRLIPHWHNLLNLPPLPAPLKMVCKCGYKAALNLSTQKN